MSGSARPADEASAAFPDSALRAEGPPRRSPGPDLHPATAAAASSPAFRALLAGLPDPGRVRTVGGCAGSLPVVAVAALSTRLPNRIWIVAAASPAAAEQHLGDLETMLGKGCAVHYPQREAAAHDEVDDDREAPGNLSGRRVEAFEAVLAQRARVVVATARALQEVAPLPRSLADLRHTVETGQRLRRDDLIAALEERGFDREPMVERVGAYTVRGGLVDLFSFGAAAPVRIEFWGDVVESIRFFDTSDQRSTEPTRRVDVLPVRFAPSDGATAAGAAAQDLAPGSLLDRLPRDALLVRTGDWTLEEQAEATWDELERRHQEALRHGNPALPPAKRFLAPAAFAERVRRHPCLAFVEEPLGDPVFDARRAPPFARDTRKLRSFLAGAALRGADSCVLCDNDGQASRLMEILADRKGELPAGCRLAVGSLAAGFRLFDAEPPANILTDHEIFQRGRQLRRSARYRGSASIDSLAQLEPGDYVVHMDHGIGRFRGLERSVIGDEPIETMAIVYDRDEVLRVPVHLLEQVERWVGAHPDDKPRSLHRIGGRRWKTLKSKTQAAINRTTVELLELYAARQSRPGHAYPPDTRWQKEMEASFLYEDTPDQRRATEDVKRDMESPRVMDRLVCGDAGYGKTEVAVRAAFKAVQDGRQVAVLAPTTVLVAQHARTFGERLADYPVNVRSLSRLDSRAGQREVVKAVADGQVDIVVGTHRLLSKDVSFHKLGLLVIDEEQRLGVRQKERLKRMRASVDVLTLTATPIPRTLYMSLAGVRDMSLMRTAPRDRLPIVTHVLPWSDHVVAEACRRELDRGGQVFFLHNRVDSIASAAERLARLVPRARIEVAHGQMEGRALDRVMTRFVDGAADILVCTSIIENGLDVSNANTLVVTRADRFGLSQLYQIRGRVGRWDRRAFCYLIVPERVTADAEKRLRVLEHHTELGSGYRIAMRDLEVRGAGNLLGEDQSGFAHAVGIDTYLRLMESTVRAIREGPARKDAPRPSVSMDADAYLPDAYVADQHQKLHLYRRLARTRRPDEVRALGDEIADRFGRPPPEVVRLLDRSLMDLAGHRAGASRVALRGGQARINFPVGVVPRMSALDRALRGKGASVEVRRVAPLSLVLECSDRPRLASLVVEALEALASGNSNNGERQ